jgi:hypothetical protein
MRAITPKILTEQRLAIRAGLALALVVAATPLAARAQLPPYRLAWLGQDFYPLAMNDHGQVVGYRAAHRGECQTPRVFHKPVGYVSCNSPGSHVGARSSGRTSTASSVWCVR